MGWTRIPIIFLGLVGLLGCQTENSQDQALGAAVSCLDGATTSAQADNCQSIVAGQTSAQAYLVRCSANMIAQGLTGSRLATAFQNMNNSSGSSTNQTAAMMSYFVFSTTLPNDTADLTNTNCSQSGSASLAGLGALVDAASIMAAAAATAAGTTLAGSNLDPTSANFNPAALQSAAATLYASNNPATNAAIGSLAMTAQTSYCATGSSLATQNVCTQLDSAIANGSGNSSNIGRSLLNLLQQ